MSRGFTADRYASIRRVAEELADQTGKDADEITQTIYAIERRTRASKIAWENSNRSGQSEDYYIAQEQAEQRNGEKVAELAAGIGLKTTWPGLYPSFTDRNSHAVSWLWAD
jgi:23S rRNA G2445 N2-methylase RlmL